MFRDMAHEYSASQYSAQTFKGFLADKSMFKRYGYAFPNAKCHTDSVTFPYSGKEFAVKFCDIKENETGIAYLEVRVNNNWKELTNKTYPVKRTKTGKISFKTYELLFDNFIIKKIADYLRSNSK